nr:NAD(+) synthase [Clostridia bacterium]
MKDGFIKVCACTPKLKVGDINYNSEQIIEEITAATNLDNKIIVFPELSITAYTCGDLFYQDIVLEKAKNALIDIAEKTKEYEIISFVGLPIKIYHNIYNVAAAVFKGEILGLVPKQYVPNYNEFYEHRQFSSGKNLNEFIDLNGKQVKISPNIIFSCKEMPSVKIACEICEDLWVMNPPSISHAINGATIIVNLSASNELVGKIDYRRELISNQSSKLYCGYIYSSSGQGESTTDMVFAASKFICENGKVLSEGEIFKLGLISSEIDCEFLEHQRRVAAQYDIEQKGDYTIIPFSLKKKETKLTRTYPRYPFVPNDSNKISKRAELILSLQAQALAKRFLHTNAQSAVIGISGGLDSALALLATIRTKKILKEEYNKELDVIGITMPCFG